MCECVSGHRRLAPSATWFHKGSGAPRQQIPRRIRSRRLTGALELQISNTPESWMDSNTRSEETSDAPEPPMASQEWWSTKTLERHTQEWIRKRGFARTPQLRTCGGRSACWTFFNMKTQARQARKASASGAPGQRAKEAPGTAHKARPERAPGAPARRTTRWRARLNARLNA